MYSYGAQLSSMSDTYVSHRTKATHSELLITGGTSDTKCRFLLNQRTIQTHADQKLHKNIKSIFKSEGRVSETLTSIINRNMLNTFHVAFNSQDPD